MTKAKFLTMSIVFALVYITCDMFFIFYIADKTDQAPPPAPQNTQYTMQRNYRTSSQIAFANQPENNTYALQPENMKAIVE